MPSGKPTPEHILKQIRRLYRQSNMSVREIARHVGVDREVARRALATMPDPEAEATGRPETASEDESTNHPPLASNGPQADAEEPDDSEPDDDNLGDDAADLSILDALDEDDELPGEHR